MFTQEELAAMAAADAEIEREFHLTPEERALSRRLDRLAGGKPQDRAAYRVEYRAENREHLRRSSLQYYYAHRDEIREKKRAYYLLHQEELREKARQYRRRKKEEATIEP